MAHEGSDGMSQLGDRMSSLDGILTGTEGDEGVCIVNMARG